MQIDPLSDAIQNFIKIWITEIVRRQGTARSPSSPSFSSLVTQELVIQSIQFNIPFSLKLMTFHSTVCCLLVEMEFGHSYLNYLRAVIYIFGLRVFGESGTWQLNQLILITWESFPPVFRMEVLSAWGMNLSSFPAELIVLTYMNIKHKPQTPCRLLIRRTLSL